MTDSKLRIQEVDDKKTIIQFEYHIVLPFRRLIVVIVIFALGLGVIFHVEVITHLTNS